MRARARHWQEGGQHAGYVEFWQLSALLLARTRLSSLVAKLPVATAGQKEHATCLLTNSCHIFALAECSPCSAGTLFSICRLPHFPSQRLPHTTGAATAAPGCHRICQVCTELPARVETATEQLRASAAVGGPWKGAGTNSLHLGCVPEWKSPSYHTWQATPLVMPDQSQLMRM